MLVVAERRASLKFQTSTLPPAVRFMHGAAQCLPFPDESFDIVTLGYGLRNLAEWEAGLREMKRVAARADAAGAGFWQTGQRPVVRSVFRLLETLRPLLAGVLRRCRHSRVYLGIIDPLRRAKRCAMPNQRTST